MDLGRKALVACLAIAIDLLLGDPPNRYHPVAWMGQAIGWAQARAPQRGRLGPLVYGAVLITTGTCTVAALGGALGLLCSGLPAGLGLLLEAGLLKTNLALRGLDKAAGEVRSALAQGELAEARRLLSWHLVSRDTSTLDDSQISAATIESVAENTSDGIIGPILYFALGGLPGALAYRFINTGDSMLGYRDAAREWLGKVPARLDDLANLLPARLTAALYVLASALIGEDTSGALLVCRRDARTTASPNAGYPMSAMAGALGVELEKVGHYRLGAGQRPARPKDIDRSIRLMRTAAILGVGALVLLGLVTRKRKQG